jgi:hypothetical protein
MNIVELLKSQLSSDVIGNLSRSIGEDEAKTRAAVGAAAPAVLAGLSGLASSGAGAQKLTDAVGALGADGAGNLAGMLTGQGGRVLLEQGEKLVASLFGGSAAGIVAALAKYTGLPQATIQKVVSLLLPMILGFVGKQFKGKEKELSAQSLTDFFADQKTNIAGALPSGLSLASIPGVQTAENAARVAAGAAQDAGKSLSRWILPLAACLLVALLLWKFWGPSAQEKPIGDKLPEVPPVTVVAQKFGEEAAETGKAVTDVTKSLTETLEGITDEATAETALPKLKDANQKLDEIRALWDKLPEAAKTTIAGSLTPQLAKLKKLIEPIFELPGVEALLKPILDEIVEKLSAFRE